MPTYEYVCDACLNGFEIVQKMQDAPIEKCPACGKKVRRVLSGGIGISFKGSGFYVTDSGASGTSAPKANTAEKKPAPAAAPAAAPAGSGAK